MNLPIVYKSVIQHKLIHDDGQWFKQSLFSLENSRFFSLIEERLAKLPNGKRCVRNSCKKIRSLWILQKWKNLMCLLLSRFWSWTGRNERPQRFLQMVVCKRWVYHCISRIQRINARSVEINNRIGVQFLTSALPWKTCKFKGSFSLFGRKKPGFVGIKNAPWTIRTKCLSNYIFIGLNSPRIDG